MTRSFHHVLLILSLLGLILACHPAPPSPTQTEADQPPPDISATLTTVLTTTRDASSPTPPLIPTPTATRIAASATTTAPPPIPIPSPTETPPPAGPTKAQQQILAALPNHGPAPAWANDVWLNSDPLYLSDLRGKVVIIEFWTYG